MRMPVAVAMLAFSWAAQAAEPLMKPFVLAAREQGKVLEVAEAAQAKLAAAGFEVAGTYAPYPGALVVAITSDELKELAATSRFGGYAAAQRVTFTKLGDEVQVAYTNPRYMAAAYRMTSDLAPVAAKLEAALGRVEEFGSDEGKSARDLRGYHYMLGMPYFDDPSRFGKFKSHAAAVEAIEAGLAAKRGGASKVYRVDLPGRAHHEGDRLQAHPLHRAPPLRAPGLRRRGLRPLRQVPHRRELHRPQDDGVAQLHEHPLRA